MTIPQQLTQKNSPDNKINFQADDQTYQRSTVLTVNCSRGWLPEMFKESADYIRDVMTNSDKPVHRVIFIDDISNGKLPELGEILAKEVPHKNRGRVIICHEMKGVALVVNTFNIGRGEEQKILYARNQDAAEAILKQFENE